MINIKIFISVFTSIQENYRKLHKINIRGNEYYGKTFTRGSVNTGKSSYGKVFIRECVHTGKYSYGQRYIWGNVNTGKCAHGKVINGGVYETFF